MDGGLLFVYFVVDEDDWCIEIDIGNDEVGQKVYCQWLIIEIVEKENLECFGYVENKGQDEVCEEIGVQCVLGVIVGGVQFVDCCVVDQCFVEVQVFDDVVNVFVVFVVKVCF